MIWNSRNLLIFQNRRVSPQEILLKAILAVKEWERAQLPPHKTDKASSNLRPSYESPITATLCNTDASYRASTKTAGLGWIFTDESAVEIERGSLLQQHVSSPIMAEALAIREALTHAISLNLTHIWLRSDSQELIRAITARRPPVELHGVLSDIDLLVNASSSSFSFCHISFISRNLNGPANLIAKACLASRNELRP